MKDKGKQKKKIKNRIIELIRKIKIPFIRVKVYLKYNIFEKIENFIDRGRKGYCFRDVWDFEFWFTHIIPKMLKEIKERSPVLVPLKDNGDVDDDRIHHIYKDDERKRWEEIIDDIIYDLEEAQDVDDNYEEKWTNPYPIDTKEYTEYIKNQNKIMREHEIAAFNKLCKYFGNFGW